MEKTKNNHIIKKRSYILASTNDIASELGSIVGSTMTYNGAYVSLQDGTTTNDGATIIDRLSSISYGSSEVKKMYVKKLKEATEKTDELAGDGTSATTVLSGILINKLFLWNKNGKSQRFMLDELNKYEKIYLDSLEKQRVMLETEEDYVNLATVSTKDKDLGELIGKAIFKSGKNAAVRIQEAQREEDYVEYDTHFTIPSHTMGVGLPEELENVKVIIVNSVIGEQSEFLDQVIKKVHTENINVVIMCKEILEGGLTFINAYNEANKNSGQITILQIPQINNRYTSEDLMKDIGAYVGAEITVVESFKSDANKLDKLKLGSIETFGMTNRGTIISNKEKTQENIDQIKKLEKELSKLNEVVDGEKIILLKNRINMLSGTTATLRVFERTSSALETKVYRIQDAIKATQFSLSYGYVPGAGVFFKKAIKDNDSTMNSIAEKYLRILIMASGIESIKPADILENKDDNISIRIKENGEASIGDVLEYGIIDAAKVIENVIKNSFTIAKEYAKLGFKVVENDE